MSTPADHASLDAARHGALVAYIIRHNPRAWRVIFAPSNYLYDERDQARATDIETRASDLRIAFSNELDWHAAMEIIHTLLQLDANACRMSIGSRIDGIDYYGEDVSA